MTDPKMIIREAFNYVPDVEGTADDVVGEMESSVYTNFGIEALAKGDYRLAAEELCYAIIAAPDLTTAKKNALIQLDVFRHLGNLEI